MAVGGCTGPQSALDPAGVDAESIGALFWLMAVGAVAIWGIVIAGAVLAVFFKPGPNYAKWSANAVIIGGGVVFPSVTLAALLVFGLQYLAPESPGDGSWRVHVTGEQWWWRVAYEAPGGERVIDANQVHLPAGEPVEFVLTSTDVIHSFWVPALGGKMDMIPGRTTRLTLTGTRPGVYNGVCAEYCGTSHTLMLFRAEVEEPDEFRAWLDAQAEPAGTSSLGATAARGRDLFVANGCGGCHTVRGVVERGSVGPDLTHFGERATIGAGAIANTPANLVDWLRSPSGIKPGAEMPAYDMLAENELEAMAAFLSELGHEEP